MSNDRPVMWSELRRIVRAVGRQANVESERDDAVPGTISPGESRIVQVVCPWCGSFSEQPSMSDANFTPPLCVAECCHQARMFPEATAKHIRPIVQARNAIDPEALADAILRSVRTWGKATFKGDPRNQRAVIRDTIKDYLKEKQE